MKDATLSRMSRVCKRARVCVPSTVLLTYAASIRWYPLCISGSDGFASTQVEPLCRCFTGLTTNAV